LYLIRLYVKGLSSVGSFRAVRTEVVIALVAVPDTVIIDLLRFRAAVACVVVAIVLSFDFLCDGFNTLSSIILTRL
jgi:hypothetical protein